MGFETVKGKVKLTHRNTTPEAQGGSTRMAPHIPEFVTTGVWVVNPTPGSLYPQERAMVYMVGDADRDTGPVWMSGKREKSLAFTVVRTPQNRLHYPGHILCAVTPRVLQKMNN
jgi:hypothetical protein